MSDTSDRKEIRQLLNEIIADQGEVMMAGIVDQLGENPEAWRGAAIVVAAVTGNQAIAKQLGDRYKWTSNFLIAITVNFTMEVVKRFRDHPVGHVAYDDVIGPFMESSRQSIAGKRGRDR